MQHFYFFFFFFFISCLVLSSKAYIVIYCIRLACQSISKNKCENEHSLVGNVSKIDNDGLDRNKKNKQNNRREKRQKKKQHSCTCRCCFCYSSSGHVAKYLPEKNMYRDNRPEVCKNIRLY